jgi:hypothetical protein
MEQALDVEPSEALEGPRTATAERAAAVEAGHISYASPQGGSKEQQ